MTPVTRPPLRLIGQGSSYWGSWILIGRSIQMRVLIGVDCVLLMPLADLPAWANQNSPRARICRGLNGLQLNKCNVYWLISNDEKKWGSSWLLYIRWALKKAFLQAAQTTPRFSAFTEHIRYEEARRRSNAKINVFFFSFFFAFLLEPLCKRSDATWQKCRPTSLIPKSPLHHRAPHRRTSSGSGSGERLTLFHVFGLLLLLRYWNQKWILPCSALPMRSRLHRLCISSFLGKFGREWISVLLWEMRLQRVCSFLA